MTNISVFPAPTPERDRAAEATTASHLIEPHGGELVDLMADAERAAELKAASRDWPSWDLTPAPVLRPRAAPERRLLAAARAS